MKRRILCIVLSMVLLLGLAPARAKAESNMTTSEECIALLKEMEGFCQYPYLDYSQWSVGYGSRVPEDEAERLAETGITEAEADWLLRTYVADFEESLNEFINACGLSLSQNQFDALLLFTYNCGYGWTNLNGVGNFRDAVRSGATGNTFLYWITQWCNAGGLPNRGLVERRLKEANMYLNGVYSNVAPQQYSYVFYNACGGTSNAPVQGYEPGTGAEPMAEATYIVSENGVTIEYQFEGWYSSRIGGTKITELGENQREATLYAHWSQDGRAIDTSETVPQGTAITPVEVLVEADWVNLREGPGLDYGIVGKGYDGQKLTITAVHRADGYQWGKFSDGWIALSYTNFDEVYNGAPSGGETTPPAPAKSVTGTVTAPSGLCIRSGPGTGNAVVGYLAYQDRVEVTDHQSAGGALWGKISSGWVCLDYVKLDGPLPSQEPVPEETKPEETKPEETKPEETKPEETKPEETKPEEPTKPTDPPVTDPTEPTKPAEPEKPKTVMGTVITDDLRIRSGPSTGYSVLGYLNTGDRVEILAQQTTGSMVWGKIDKGWISLDYVKLDAASGGGTNTGSQGGASVTGTVVNAGSLRIRSGPGTSYSILGYLTDGTKVTITEQTTVGSMVWGKIDKGWISLDYVKLDAASAPEDPAKTQTGTVKVSDYLNVRSGPGTSYSIVAYLNPNTKVTITETKSSGGTLWGKMEKGWVSMDYIQLDAASGGSGGGTDGGSTGESGGGTGSTEPSAPATITGTVIADALHVRKAPGVGNEIVGYLYYGSKVVVLETTEVSGVQWGRVSNGWICMDYVRQ